jgi:hypothetical protein
MNVVHRPLSSISRHPLAARALAAVPLVLTLATLLAACGPGSSGGSGY